MRAMTGFLFCSIFLRELRICRDRRRKRRRFLNQPCDYFRIIFTGRLEPATLLGYRLVRRDQKQARQLSKLHRQIVFDGAENRVGVGAGENTRYLEIARGIIEEQHSAALAALQIGENLV